MSILRIRYAFLIKIFYFKDFERLLLAFPTDHAKTLLVFVKRRTYDMIYETENFMIDFHTIPFPRKGQDTFAYGMGDAREITIYNDTIFSVSHRKLMYFEEDWIADRFNLSHMIYFV